MIQNLQIGCEALVDISLELLFITNTSQSFSNKIVVELNLITQISNTNALPYQLMNNAQIESSYVTLQGYRTKPYILYPKKLIKIVDTITISAINFPYMQGKVNLWGINQRVSIRLCAHLPIFFPWHSVSLQGCIQTQLLGIKCKKNSFLPKSIFYSIVDCLVEENNRLNRKIHSLENQIVARSVISQAKQNQSIINILSQSIDIPQFPQFKVQKLGQYRAIFHHNSNSDKQKLFSLQNFCYEASNYMQIKWKQYMSIKQNNLDQQFQSNKIRYYKQYRYQLNRISSKLFKNQEGEDNNSESNNQDQFIINAHSIKIPLNFSINRKEFNCPLDSSSSLISLSNIKSCQQLVILVHGYGASSISMVLYQKILQFLYPDVQILNSRANQYDKHYQKSIQQMGKSLATQIELYLHGKSLENIEISFIAHSLGGIVVRDALTHLETYKFNMNSFISISCPHFGHLQHSNKLTKVGMIAINMIWNNVILKDLLFKDSQHIRSCYLYNLGFHSGMSWFQAIHLYGSPDDGYVSDNSARFQVPSSLKQTQNIKVLRQMKAFFEQNLKTTKVEKYEIIFDENQAEEQNLYEKILGRGPHLAFLNNQTFINCVLMNCSKAFQSSMEDQ